MKSKMYYSHERFATWLQYILTFHKQTYSIHKNILYVIIYIGIRVSSYIKVGRGHFF